jgi:hypothetical protein
MLLSSIFRVVNTYHPSFLANPNLYFPLLAAPEAASALLLSLGRAYAQVGLGGRLEEFQAKQLPWQQARAAAAAAAAAGAKAGSPGVEDPEQGIPAILARSA